MDVTKIFDLHYLFVISPGRDFEQFWFWAGFFSGILLGGILLTLLATKIFDELKVRAMRGFNSKLIWYGLGGFVLLFFRVNGAPYLSMRIWLLLYLLLFFVIIYFEYKRISRNYRNKIEMKDRREKSADNKKYLPHKKKRK